LDRTVDGRRHRAAAPVNAPAEASPSREGDRHEEAVMATILPTHHCFDDALEYVEQRVIRDSSLAFDTRLVLAHGILLVPEGHHADRPFVHAWCEETEDGHSVVWDAGMLDGERVWFSVDRAEWTAAMRPQLVTRYTLREAWAENVRSGTYGPWCPEYLALCGAGHTIFD
jgi:hypothetical protein